MSALQIVMNNVRSLTDRRHPLEFSDGQVILVRTGSSGVVGCGHVQDVSNLGLCIDHNLPLVFGDTVLVVSPQNEIATEVVWTVDKEHGKSSGLRLLLPADAAADRMAELREAFVASENVAA